MVRRQATYRGRGNRPSQGMTVAPARVETVEVTEEEIKRCISLVLQTGNITTESRQAIAAYGLQRLMEEWATSPSEERWRNAVLQRPSGYYQDERIFGSYQHSENTIPLAAAGLTPGQLSQYQKTAARLSGHHHQRLYKPILKQFHNQANEKAALLYSSKELRYQQAAQVLLDMVENPSMEIVPLHTYLYPSNIAQQAQQEADHRLAMKAYQDGNLTAGGAIYGIYATDANIVKSIQQFDADIAAVQQQHRKAKQPLLDPTAIYLLRKAAAHGIDPRGIVQQHIREPLLPAMQQEVLQVAIAEAIAASEVHLATEKGATDTEVVMTITALPTEQTRIFSKEKYGVAPGRGSTSRYIDLTAKQVAAMNEADLQQMMGNTPGHMVPSNAEMTQAQFAGMRYSEHRRTYRWRVNAGNPEEAQQSLALNRQLQQIMAQQHAALAARHQQMLDQHLQAALQAQTHYPKTAADIQARLHTACGQKAKLSAENLLELMANDQG